MVAVRRGGAWAAAKATAATQSEAKVKPWSTSSVSPQTGSRKLATPADMLSANLGVKPPREHLEPQDPVPRPGGVSAV